jgi:hypothetical protein
MRLRAPRFDTTELLPYVFPFLVLFLMPAACDDAGEGPGDGGGRPDAATPDGGGGDAPPAGAACNTLTTGTTLMGLIDDDATWRGAIAVTGDVLVGAAKITIEAGTTFVMGPDASLTFGWNSNVNSVFARGTEASPIRFCGKQAAVGYYKRISFGDKVTSDSVLEWVKVSDGGQGSGPALELKAPVLVKNVEVIGSGGDGVHAEDFKAGSEKLTVRGSARLPMVLLNAAAATRLPLGGSYKMNTTDLIALRFNGIEDQEVTFHDAGVPYLQEMSIDTRAAVPKLTFAAGVDYRLAVDVYLTFGWNGNATTVLMNGTADKPVLFGKASDSAGSWKSIIFQTMIRSDSVLKYVKVRGGGNGGPALDIRSPMMTIDHLTLEGNQTGLTVEGKGFSTQSTTLTITGTTTGPAATVEPDVAVTLPKGGTFSGNTSNWIAIKGGHYEAVGTLPDLGLPYRVDGDIDTWMGSSLTIEAGVTVLMAADTNIEFGWNGGVATLTAVGTMAKPIVFKGVEDNAGYWEGLTVQSMLTSSSKLDWVEVRNAGKTATDAALTLYRSIGVTNSKFVKSVGYAIKKLTADTTDYATGGNTFEMCAAGNVGNM